MFSGFAKTQNFLLRDSTFFSSFLFFSSKVLFKLYLRANTHCDEDWKPTMVEDRLGILISIR